MSATSTMISLPRLRTAKRSGSGAAVGVGPGDGGTGDGGTGDGGSTTVAGGRLNRWRSAMTAALSMP